MPAKRLEQGAMGEPLGERQVLPIAGEREHVGEHLVHPAVLGGQHLLQLVIRQRRDERSAPVRQADQDLPCLLYARNGEGVAQPSEQLVQVVPGHPRAVEPEALDAKRPGPHLGPQLSAAGNRADISVAVRALTRRQLAHHVVEPAPHLGVARGRPGLGQRCEIVTGGVALQPCALPVGVRRCLRLKASLRAVGRKESIDVERAEVLEVQRLGALEWPAGQSHL